MDSQETAALTRIADEFLKEQRRRRRWGMAFRFAIVVLVVFAVFVSASRAPLPGAAARQGDHVALISVYGPIFPNAAASAVAIAELLEEAYENEHAKAIVLEINSPGGSPVQAERIVDTLLALRKAHPDKPVYAVVEDLCASAGYYIASAADEIYAGRASIVGSIGVVLSGFGFVEALEKLGIERRLLTAGEHKGLLDPFLPENRTEIKNIQDILDAIHEQFIDRVKMGRGDRLSDDPDLFSGLLWTGEKARALGLIDDFGDARHVADNVVKVETIIEYEQPLPLLERILDRAAVSLAHHWRTLSPTF